MEIIDLKLVGEKIYHEILDNGLDVYVLRKKDFELGTAHFITKFGGLDIEFMPINEDKMTKFPAGIAHFLEHKLFEQEKGETVADFFKKSGTQFNASTNEFRTRYYFSGVNNFKENLNFLIDYVQSPYFTDENVEKEKGIIKEEILMCKDDPYRRLIEVSMHNLFTSYPYENTVVGEIEDINRITKEDLYKCYNTFYHPSNMCLVVVSKFDEKEIIELIKDNQKKKNYKKNFNVIKKEYEEEEKVRKEYDVIYDKVTQTRFSYSVKMKIDKFKISKAKLLLYSYILLDILVGELSTFTLDLKKNNKIIDTIGFSIEFIYDDYIVFNFIAKPENEEEFKELLEKQLNVKNIKEEEFEMIKKSIVSSELFDYNNVNGSISALCNNYLLFGRISNEEYEEERNANYEEFLNVVNTFNLDNKSILIQKPKEEE